MFLVLVSECKARGLMVSCEGSDAFRGPVPALLERGEDSLKGELDDIVRFFAARSSSLSFVEVCMHVTSSQCMENEHTYYIYSVNTFISSNIRPISLPADLGFDSSL